MNVPSRKLHLRGGFEQLLKSLSLVGEGARRAGLSAPRRTSLETAAREACLAILESGQHDQHQGTVEVEVGWDEHAITVSFVHAGPGVDDLMDRAPMNARIECMQRAVDEVRYLRDPARGHQLLLITRL